MNTTETPTTTLPTRISSLGLKLAEDTPALMAGDTIHLEVTLKVETVTQGLDWSGKPYLSYGVQSIDGSPGVVRAAGGTPEIPAQLANALFDRFGTKRGVVLMEDPNGGEPVDITDAVPAPAPDRWDRAVMWLAAHWVRVLLGTAVLAVILALTACSTATTPAPAPGPAVIGSESFWGDYTPQAKARILAEVEAKDCTALQAEFDKAVSLKAEAPGRNAALLAFLDSQMTTLGCYEAKG